MPEYGPMRSTIPLFELPEASKDGRARWRAVEHRNVSFDMREIYDLGRFDPAFTRRHCFWAKSNLAGAVGPITNSGATRSASSAFSLSAIVEVLLRSMGMSIDDSLQPRS